MHRSIRGSLVGALAVMTVAAPSALAAGPATVDVRVVGPRGPLVETVVRTTRRAVVKDGRNACSGTSAAGALELATGGRWSATWFDGLGYSVQSVAGVRPASAADFWALWVNDRSSTTGLCDTDLRDGDDVLLFVCADSDPRTYECGNRPLGLVAPRRAKGRTVTVRTVVFANDGSSAPAAGATVAGGVRPVRSDARGVARVQLQPEGQTALVAERAGDVASAPTLCTVVRGGARCGGQDTTAPLLRVTNVRPGQVFGARTAPRAIRGIARDPGGALVELRLTRRHAGRCSAYVGNRETFVPCPRRGAPWFMAGDRERWSYLLPARLAPGRYTLGVLASDRNDNVRRLTLRFRVRAAAGARAAAAPTAGAAAVARVKVKAVGRSRTLVGTRTVAARATTVKVGRKRCAVAGNTPLAGLLAAARRAGQSVTVSDYGSCSRRAVDGGGLFVAKVGPDRGRGQAGWVFAVDGRVGTAGGADSSGPFGSGRLRSGQKVVWFWCAKAGACGRVPS